MVSIPEERIAVLEANHLDVMRRLTHIDDHLDELSKKLSGRPSWATSVVITFLSSATVGLAVAFVSLH